ncbi:MULTISPECIES: HAD family hydrolase [unclassified Pseudoclavibacter]|uniref:HAD family hydrolase n=1 Tax=unclassified Pseudoclavibacter TaxID=2615177 RepID=UPI000CE7A2EA|nr:MULTISPECIES: HAD family hydrolase [unclassified Pseudoclavibacter]PPF36558.1 hypothetical protein C5E05_09960 [Pseudoclavibacter sp. AY1H1]VXB56657.1 conserved hypothetical protein [Pseudoclavibacter sp. 8L]
MPASVNLDTVRAVALDVDGTIAGADHQLTPRTTAALRSLVEHGIPVILLTGRARQNVLELAREAGIRNTVASNNGAVIFDPVEDTNTTITPMTHAEARRILDLGARLGLERTWWSVTDIYVDRDGECSRMLRELNERDIIVGDPDELPDDITKVMLFGSEAELDEVADRIFDAAPSGTRSMYCFFEFVAPDATKWHALETMLEEHGVDPAHTLGLGDGGNDLAWLTQIGFPFAMENARQEVKDIAIGVVGHHAHDGAAEILEELARSIGADAPAPTAKQQELAEQQEDH